MEEGTPASDAASLPGLHHDLAQARQRWHKTTDLVQVHEGRLGTLEWRLAQTEQHLAKIEGEMEQLVTGAQLESLREMLDFRLKNLSEALDLINRGARWIVGTVLAAVLLAVLSLVLRATG